MGTKAGNAAKGKATVSGKSGTAAANSAKSSAPVGGSSRSGRGVGKSKASGSTITSQGGKKAKGNI